MAISFNIGRALFGSRPTMNVQGENVPVRHPLLQGVVHFFPPKQAQPVRYHPPIKAPVHPNSKQF